MPSDRRHTIRSIVTALFTLGAYTAPRTRRTGDAACDARRSGDARRDARRVGDAAGDPWRCALARVAVDHPEAYAGAQRDGRGYAVVGFAAAAPPDAVDLLLAADPGVVLVEGLGHTESQMRSAAADLLDCVARAFRRADLSVGLGGIRPVLTLGIGQDAVPVEDASPSDAPAGPARPLGALPSRPPAAPVGVRLDPEVDDPGRALVVGHLAARAAAPIRRRSGLDVLVTVAPARRRVRTHTASLGAA